MQRKFFMKTERIGFSIWNENDKNLAKLLWGNPRVTKLICATGKFSEEDILNRLNTEICNGEVHKVQYWPIFTLDSNDLIGCSGLRPHGADEYEIGFHLREEFWGKGYAKEAAEAVISYAFCHLKAKKLFAGHNPKNIASKKLLAKLGFTYIGDEFYEPTGLYHPSYELENKGDFNMKFETIKKNLEDKGYKVSLFNSATEATEYIADQLDGKTVGFGGSVTLDEMGLYERLTERNNVFWHWRIPEGKTAADMRREANNAQVYISSVNGIAETGEIINIDGTCNRVAAIVYGHEKVYLIAGANKIAEDYDKAYLRARNIAAPLNAKRLGVKTPCAVNGDKCYNCKSPDRICKNLSVLWEKPIGGDFEVVLIDEKLGY